MSKLGKCVLICLQDCIESGHLPRALCQVRTTQCSPAYVPGRGEPSQLELFGCYYEEGEH